MSINTLLNGKEEASMKGFMIATCCHHKCEYNTYINREFLINLGFNEEELKIFFIISSWYISKMEAESENEWISSERKAILGKMVKRIVDIGRALCLFS